MIFPIGRLRFPFFSAVVVGIVIPILATSTEFSAACRDGADAKVEIRVVDDTGHPVNDAQVNVLFDMADRNKSTQVSKCSDTNGLCHVTGRTRGVLQVEVSRAGFYGSRRELSFIDQGHENGRWMPWGGRHDIVLRQIKNPTAISCPLRDWINTRVLNRWAWFDLAEHDFLPPHGRGKVGDVELRIDWDGSFGRKHTGMGVWLRFCQRHAGAYYSGKADSEFPGVYEADPNAKYEKEFHFWRRPVRDSRGRKIGGEGPRFDRSRILVVRSRCVEDEKGNLIAARYSQLSDLEFSCTPDGSASIKFFLIYNPVQNDTNLEPQK